MKKLRKIAILTIIFVLSAVLNVYAADYATNELIKITLKPTATEVKPGDTISIVVAGKTQSELEGISAILEYDSTKLQFTGQTIHEYYMDLTGKDIETKEINLVVMYGSLTAPEIAPSEADLLTLNFKVLDAATEGETLSVKLSGLSAGDFMYDDWVDLSDKEVTLTVVGEGDQTPGDDDQTPGDDDQTPGDDDQTPGDDDQTPGDDDQTLGDDDQTPGDDDQTPGDDDQTPGDDDQTPGDDDQTPGDDDQTPGNDNQTPGDKEHNLNKNEKPKDETIADKPINHAGSETYVYVMMGAIVVISIALYAKCKKYSDVK